MRKLRAVGEWRGEGDGEGVWSPGYCRRPVRGETDLSGSSPPPTSNPSPYACSSPWYLGEEMPNPSSPALTTGLPPPVRTFPPFPSPSTVLPRPALPIPPPLSPSRLLPLDRGNEPYRPPGALMGGVSQPSG